MYCMDSKQADYPALSCVDRTWQEIKRQAKAKGWIVRFLETRQLDFNSASLANEVSILDVEHISWWVYSQ